MSVERTPDTNPGAPGAVRIGGARLSATVIGGAWLTIASLRHREIELLASPETLVPHYRVHGQRAGITLLHPWANRLGADCYERCGVRGSLPPGTEGVARDPNGLAIHGLGLAGRWTVVRDSDSSCRAAASCGTHPAFPYPHRVEVQIALELPDRLGVSTSVWASGAQPVPIAFGWHPYFLIDPAARPDLVLPERRALELDQLGLPTGRSTARPAERLATAWRHLDDLFAEIADGAGLTLVMPAREIRVTHEAGYPCAQVFAPGDAPIVSLEPMTAPTDALRSAVGVACATAERPSFARFTVQVCER